MRPKLALVDKCGYGPQSQAKGRVSGTNTYSSAFTEVRGTARILFIKSLKIERNLTYTDYELVSGDACSADK
jgi:hypothetical protein